MRGFWYMLEAIIAGIIIIGFLAVISQTFINPQQSDLSARAYDALKGLDQQGVLRPYAAAGDWGGLNSEVRIYDSNHSIMLCTHSQCVGQRPEANNVWVGNYMIAGDQTYNPVQVRLYMW